MAGYVLYFPGAKRHEVDGVMASACLESLKADCGPSLAERLKDGPDGGAGMLAWWDSPTAPLPNADFEWRQFDGYWLGFVKGDRPTPFDLQRKRLHQGAGVVLEDGNEWIIPIARQLPHLLGIGEPRVKDAYKPFFDACWKAVQEWLVVTDDGPQWSIPWNEGFYFATNALVQNYRVTPEIVDALELISNEHLCDIVSAATQGMAIEHMLTALKKNCAPAEQSTQLSGGGAPD